MKSSSRRTGSSTTPYIPRSLSLDLSRENTENKIIPQDQKSKQINIFSLSPSNNSHTAHHHNTDAPAAGGGEIAHHRERVNKKSASVSSVLPTSATVTTASSTQSEFSFTSLPNESRTTQANKPSALGLSKNDSRRNSRSASKSISNSKFTSKNSKIISKTPMKSKGKSKPKPVDVDPFLQPKGATRTTNMNANDKNGNISDDGPHSPTQGHIPAVTATAKTPPKGSLSGSKKVTSRTRTNSKRRMRTSTSSASASGSPAASKPARGTATASPSLLHSGVGNEGGAYYNDQKIKTKTPMTGRKNIKRGRGSRGSLDFIRNGNQNQQYDQSVSMEEPLDLNQQSSSPDLMKTAAVVRKDDYSHSAIDTTNVFDTTVLDSILESNFKLDTSAETAGVSYANSSVDMKEAMDNGSASSDLLSIESEQKKEEVKTSNGNTQQASSPLRSHRSSTNSMLSISTGNDFSSLLSEHSHMKDDGDDEGTMRLGDIHIDMNMGINLDLTGMNIQTLQNANADETDTDACTEASLTEVMRRIEGNVNHVESELDLALQLTDVTALGGRKEQEQANKTGLTSANGNADANESADDKMSQHLKKLDLLLTPAPTAGGLKSFTPSPLSSPSPMNLKPAQHGAGATGKSPSDTSHNGYTSGTDKNISKSYSDTEAIAYHTMSNQHLEDILAKGGEEALDQALDQALERLVSESDANSGSLSEFSSLGGRGGVAVGGVSLNSSAPFPQVHSSSYCGGATPLDYQFLRSNLKSSLIALRSVKAERRDLESNFEKMEKEFTSVKEEYEERWKQMMLERDQEKEANSQQMEICRELEIEVMAVSKEKEELGDELQRTARELEILQGKLTETELDLETNRCRVEDLDAELDAMKIQNKDVESKSFEVATLTTQLEQEKARCEGLEATLKKLMLEMESKDEESNVKLMQMEEDLSKLSQVQSEADELMIRLDDVCGQLNETQALLEDKDENFSELQDKFTAKESELNSFKEQLNVFNSSHGIEGVRKTQNSVDILKNTLKSFEMLEEKMTLKDQATIVMKSELQKLQSDLTHAANVIQQRDDDIARLESTSSDLRDTISILQEENVSKDENINHLRDKIDELNGENAVNSLKDIDKIDRLETALESAEKEVKSLRGDLNVKNQIITEMQCSIEKSNHEAVKEGECVVASLSQELKETRTKALAVENELLAKIETVQSEAEKRIEKLYEQGTLEGSEVKLKALSEDVMSKDAEIEKLNDVIDLKLEEIDTLTKDLLGAEELKATVDKHIMDLDSQVQSKNIEIANLKDTVKHLEEEVTNLGRNTDRKDDSLEALEASKEQLKDDLDLMTSENDKLRKTLESKISQLDICSKRMDELQNVLNNNEKAASEAEIRLESTIEELRNEIEILNVENQNKHSDLDNLRREMRLSELESMKAKDFDGRSAWDEANSEKMDREIQTELVEDNSDSGQQKLEAKEAVRELVTELNIAISEKKRAMDELSQTQAELEQVKGVCNQRELESCALETSLRKALAMTNNTVIDDEVRQVIGELVEEIGRVNKGSCNAATIEDCALNTEDLKPLNDSAVAEKETSCAAKDAFEDMQEKFMQQESEICETRECLLRLMKSHIFGCQNIISQQGDNGLDSESLPSLVDNLMKLMEGTQSCEKSADECIARNSPVSSHSTLESGPLDNSNARNSPISSRSSSESILPCDSNARDSPLPSQSSPESMFSTDIDPGDDNSTCTRSDIQRCNSKESFTIALNEMLNQSSEVIQNALSDFNSDYCDGGENGENGEDDHEEAEITFLAKKAPMVEFTVYESLRRKYDLLQDEREDLLNETFALIDSSAAAKEAEFEAIKARLEKEAELRLAECLIEKEEKIQYYEERLALYACKS